MLIGTLYSHLADSYMGLANPTPSPSPSHSPPSSSHIPSTPKSSSPPSSRVKAFNIAKAELYIDRARECFKRSAYLDGECEQLMKKAIIAKLRGDEKLAEEWAQRHNRVWEEGMKALED
jgi:anaphase-promoting complex subunit 5